MGPREDLKNIEQEYARTQKHKATEGHLGRLKAKMAKLRAQIQMEETTSTKSFGETFDVKASGHGTVALIGFPSVGKSSLMQALTGTESEVADYEFTTLTCIPGNIEYKGTRIQLKDLPGIIEEASEGKGDGRKIIASAKNSDLIFIVLDAAKEQNNQHRNILENELYKCGIRLNEQPPDIDFRLKATGGVKFNSTLKLTKLGPDPEKVVKNILSEYKIHNCHILIREDVTMDQLIDVIFDCKGRVKYLRCLYIYNKIDAITMEEVDELARKPHSLVISVRLELNLDYLLEKMWEYMGLTRIYTKRKGGPPDLEEPVVLSAHREGVTVEAACKSISKDLLDNFNYAFVWGTSAKHIPQRVGQDHVLEDEDVLQIYGKTVSQQKHSKDYNKKVQAYYDAWKRKKRVALGKDKKK